MLSLVPRKNGANDIAAARKTMNENDLKKLKEMISGSVFDMLQEKLAPIVGDLSAAKTREIVQQMMVQRSVYGKDITGLNKSVKLDFVKAVQAVAFDKLNIDVKANEALVVDQDNRGGYLVSQEVADAIMRIAASVGTILSQAMTWTMNKDELAIPNYTGSFLTGSYVGIDQAGTIQGLAFGQAVLAVKKWQLAFAVGNDLLQDENVNLADWLLAIAGESMANMIDQQGFAGGSGLSLNTVTVNGPFLGILGLSTTTTLAETGQSAYLYYLGNASTSGKTAFSNMDVILDSSNAIASLEESVLNDAAFYFHRTVWGNLRAQKDTAGNYIIPYAAWAPGTLEQLIGGGPVKPAGYLNERPVYTNRWLTPLSATAANTKFGVFGNMKCMAFGDRGEMSVEVFTSGAFGGKEIALADQRGIVYRHRHALVPVLPRGFTVISTSVS